MGERKHDKSEDKTPEKRKNVKNEDKKRKHDKSLENDEPLKKVHVGSGYHTSNPLPDVFVGLRIHLRPGLEDSDRLRRYMVGYGADEAEDWPGASHIVYPEGCPDAVDCPTAVHVSDQWLVDSVKLKKVQDVDVYKIGRG